jgi:hypothetical protein
MARVPVNDKMMERARELFKHGNLSIGHRAKLRRIISGEVKSIGSEWWRQVNDAANRRKLEKISAMADPARNPSEHQRRVAEAMIAKLRAASPPGLEEYDRQCAQRWTGETGLFDDFVQSIADAASEDLRPPKP